MPKPLSAVIIPARKRGPAAPAASAARPPRCSRDRHLGSLPRRIFASLFALFGIFAPLLALLKRFSRPDKGRN